jgi:hypothetical protein
LAAVDVELLALKPSMNTRDCVLAIGSALATAYALLSGITTGSALDGYWTNHIAATAQIIAGLASFAASSATVQVYQLGSTMQRVLRDRNLRNDPVCQ